MNCVVSRWCLSRSVDGTAGRIFCASLPLSPDSDDQRPEGMLHQSVVHVPNDGLVLHSLDLGLRCVRRKIWSGAMNDGCHPRHVINIVNNYRCAQNQNVNRTWDVCSVSDSLSCLVDNTLAARRWSCTSQLHSNLLLLCLNISISVVSVCAVNTNKSVCCWDIINICGDTHTMHCGTISSSHSAAAAYRSDVEM